MAVRITVRPNGPLFVDLTGDPVELVDHEGNPIPIPQGKPHFKLCRCGASTNKPFCDGTHSRIGFQGAEEARKEFDSKQG